jgi:hypothetical protein
MGRHPQRKVGPHEEGFVYRSTRETVLNCSVFVGMYDCLNNEIFSETTYFRLIKFFLRVET